MGEHSLTILENKVLPFSHQARLAQSVEHETLNLRVVGSSPTLGEYSSWSTEKNANNILSEFGFELTPSYEYETLHLHQNKIIS